MMLLIVVEVAGTVCDAELIIETTKPTVYVDCIGSGLAGS